MLADIHQIITEAETKMSSAIRYLDDELARIRAGKASPRILDNVKVSYYGSMTPLANVSSITTPDAKTMIITPWEKPMLKEIEKAILSSEIGITIHQTKNILFMLGRYEINKGVSYGDFFQLLPWQEGSVSEDTMTWSLPSPTRDPIEYTQTKEAFDAQQAATPPAP